MLFNFNICFFFFTYNLIYKGQKKEGTLAPRPFPSEMTLVTLYVSCMLPEQNNLSP